MARSKKQTKQINESIYEIDACQVFQSNGVKYAQSVIEDRALPDIRDGLKPVGRHIIYDMFLSKATSTNRLIKQARITGNVIGKWHPHGDAPVKEAMDNMTAWWKNSLPTIYIKGNGGSVLGDPAAAARYIEVQLTKAGDAYCEILKPGIVEYVPNYDETEIQPTILPAQLPYLLINGVFGIAVGESSSIPTHNPIEVINAFIAYAKNNKITIEEILDIMPGPDFPTGGQVINASSLPEIYKTGSGSIRVRPHIHKDPKTRTLTVYSVPGSAAGRVNALVEELVTATNETVKVVKNQKKKIPPKVAGVDIVRNMSGKDGLAIEIIASRGVDLDKLETDLLAKTSLETTITYKFNALNNKVINTYSIKEYFKEYLDFQHEIVTNEFRMEKERLERRIEVVDGFLALQDVIDEVVASAKASMNKEELCQVLMTGLVLDGVPKKHHSKIKKFSFTEIQADEIARLPIHRINRMDYDNYLKERSNLEKELATAIKYSENKTARKNLIIKRHTDRLKQLPADEYARKTDIIDASASVASKLEVPEVPMYVSMDRYAYVSISDKPFDDSYETSNKRRLGFIDKDGVMWNYFLDRAKPTTGRGTFVEQLVEAQNIIGMTTYIDENDPHFGLFIFKDGNMRITDMSTYMTKTRATAVKSGKSEHELLAYYNIPNGTTSITINDKTFNIDSFSKQGKSGHGKRMMKPLNDVVVVFNND